MAKPEPAVDLVDIQQSLMRFADEYSTRMTIGIDQLRKGAQALDPAERLRWKIAFGSAVCTIVSGPNEAANLLDLIVFVTEARLALEDHWQPQVFGDSAQTMVDSCRLAETELWRLAEQVLKPDQQAALREAILVWHRENALPQDLLSVRASGLALQVVQTRAGAAKPSSLLGLLMLDPLAGLDPARRELAETRLFAERALFVAQKMPNLLRWQTELLSLSVLEHPVVQAWTTNAAGITVSADRFADVAERLPLQISAEREALVDALESQERALKPLLEEARRTLEAGSRLAVELDTTLAVFDGVLARLGVGEPDDEGGNDPANSPPFRILDYAETAEQLEAAARQLTELLKTFDATLGQNSREALAEQVGPAVRRVQSGGQELVDYAFKKGVLWVAVVLAAALLYRVLATLLARFGAKKEGPP
jgi:hypothetical protein